MRRPLFEDFASKFHSGRHLRWEIPLIGKRNASKLSTWFLDSSSARGEFVFRRRTNVAQIPQESGGTAQLSFHTLLPAVYPFDVVSRHLLPFRFQTTRSRQTPVHDREHNSKGQPRPFQFLIWTVKLRLEIRTKRRGNGDEVHEVVTLQGYNKKITFIRTRQESGIYWYRNGAILAVILCYY